jgi:hypothetical protein
MKSYCNIEKKYILCYIINKFEELFFKSSVDSINIELNNEPVEDAEEISIHYFYYETFYEQSTYSRIPTEYIHLFTRDSNFFKSAKKMWSGTNVALNYYCHKKDNLLFAEHLLEVRDKLGPKFRNFSLKITCGTDIENFTLLTPYLLMILGGDNVELYSVIASWDPSSRQNLFAVVFNL